MGVLGSQGGGQRCKDLSGTRQQADVPLLVMLAGAGTFSGIACFGRKKLPLLRPFKDGTPLQDRIGDIFATLDAQQFQRYFVAC